MKTTLHFDDVLLVPQFSDITSRKDVDITTRVAGQSLSLGIVSSNMDTVTGPNMAHAINNVGGVGCLHRFQTIDENVSQFKASPDNTWGSFGIGSNELERALALVGAGCNTLVLDVAHGATMEVVRQVKRLRDSKTAAVNLVVGNFATGQSIKDFLYHLGNHYDVDAFKVGIGSGAACTTQRVTGHGLPIFTSLLDCVASGQDIICDGGVRNSGDFAKALAVGAKAVMMGRVLAGTTESPGEIEETVGGHGWEMKGTNLCAVSKKFKKYRGSASHESYGVQGKIAGHRTAEGEAYTVPYTGTVAETLQPFEAGLRSAMSYSGARNLEEFKEKAEWVQVTHAGFLASFAHGKNL